MRVKIKEIIQIFQITRSVSETARQLGIHRVTVWRWIKRARNNSKMRRGTLSTKGLQRLKPGGKYPRRKLTKKQESAIIQVRNQTGFAAVKIKEELGLNVGINTIHRLLKRKHSTDYLLPQTLSKQIMGWSFKEDFTNFVKRED